jgi:hypothetical protein
MTAASEQNKGVNMNTERTMMGTIQGWKRSLALRLFVLAVVAASAGLVAGTAAAATLNDTLAGAKLSADLQAEVARGNGSTRVIVTYAPGTTERKIQGIRKRSGDVLSRIEGAGGLTGELSHSEILSVAADPSVVSIHPDRPVRGTMDVAVAAVGSDRVAKHLGLAGKGITVAVIDSGLTPSAAIPAGRILASVDFTV